MNKLEYSALVKKKMKALKKWLTDHFGEDTAKKVLTGITDDADILIKYEKKLTWKEGGRKSMKKFTCFGLLSTQMA